MTDQAPPLEAIQPSHVPQRTFVERCSFLGVYVLPAMCLDNTPLKDEAGKPILNLRQQCSRQGLCFAHILHPTTAGDQYWADIAATPDMKSAEYIVLTEEQLAFAMAWDERLYHLSPVQIRRLMAAQARDLEPLCPHKEPEQAETAAPPVLLVAQAPVIVSSEELQETLAPASKPPQKSYRPIRSTRQVPLAVQQGLLLAMLRTLQQQIEQAQDVITAQTLQARCALLEHMQRWQQQTHQRVVNVSSGWCAQRHRPVWSLTLGVPETLLALEGATMAAA